MDHFTLPLFSLQPETKEIPLTQGYVAVVDAADYDWLMQWKWWTRTRPDCRSFYAMRTFSVDGVRTALYMHRVILGINDRRVEVDHIDSDGLNNTRGNLRTATRQQNAFNMRSYRNTTSQYKGVVWRESHGKWCAQIEVNGKRTHLGYFGTEVEAAIAYDRAARKHFGQYARTNFQEG